MTTIKQLEKERINQIKNLEPKEVDGYIENLTNNLYLAFKSSNIDKMEYYNNLLVEVTQLLEGIYNNVPGVIGKYDQEYSKSYLTYYDYSQHLLGLTINIKQTIEFNGNVNRSYLTLLFLMESLYYFTKDLLADNVVNINDVALVKKYNDVIIANKWSIEEYSQLAKPLNNLFLEYDFKKKIEELEKAKQEIKLKYKILNETDIIEKIDRTIDLLGILEYYITNADLEEELEEANKLINSSNGFLEHSRNIFNSLKENNPQMSFEQFLELEPKYNLKECQLIQVKPLNEEIDLEEIIAYKKAGSSIKEIAELFNITLTEVEEMLEQRR